MVKIEYKQLYNILSTTIKNPYSVNYEISNLKETGLYIIFDLILTTLKVITRDIPSVKKIDVCYLEKESNTKMFLIEKEQYYVLFSVRKNDKCIVFTFAKLEK